MASLCLTCPAMPPAVNIGTEASPPKVQIPEELENRFDSWAKKNHIIIRLPNTILDERYHVDRIQINDKNKPHS